MVKYLIRFSGVVQDIERVILDSYKTNDASIL